MKMKVNKRSIKNELITVFSAIFLIAGIIIVVFGTYKSSSSIKEVSNEIIDDKLYADVNAMNSYLQYKYGGVKKTNGKLTDKSGLDIAGDTEVVDKVLQDLSDVATIYVKNGDEFEIVSTNIRDKDNKRITGTLEKNQAAYKSLMNDKAYNGITIVNGQQYKSTYSMIVGQSGKTIGVLFVGMSIENVNASIASNLSEIRIAYYILGAVCLVVCIAVTYFVGNAITKNLIKIAKYTNNMKELDISQDIPEGLNKLKDEVGTVSNSLQVAVTSLRKFISDSDSMASSVNNHAGSVLENMEQVTNTSGEIAEVINQIAEGATNQAKDIENGSQETEELGKYIDLNNKEFDTLVKLMDQVDKLRAQGYASVNSLSEESKEALAATSEIYEVIKDTNDKAKNIEVASAKIKDVAEQTNLLSLNAVIEAARAGEAGKGFSVVAEEVSNLADESNKLVQEIEVVIQELTSRTESAVETVDKMINMMKNQDVAVGDTVEKFNGISQSITETKASIDRLNESSNNMNDKKKVIIDVMQDLSAIAEENAAFTEEVAASVQEQTSIINELSNSVEDMVEMSKDMKKNIEKFQY
jgi:methyl-accepting chemotaxis protein